MSLTFREFLISRGYSLRTIKEYEMYEGILLRGHVIDGSIDQDGVERFFLNNRNGVSRAFLKCYLHEYLGHREFVIPRFRGRKKKPETAYLKSAEVYQIVKGLDLEVGLAFLLCFEGGLRLKELCDLQWRDIDFDKKRIKVMHGKGDKFREVMFSELTKTVMLQYLDMISEPTDFVIRYSYKRLQGIINERCNFERRIHWHMLRHSCGFWLTNELNMPIDEVAIYLGHSNVNTAKIYTHKNKERVLDKVASSF